MIDIGIAQGVLGFVLYLGTVSVLLRCNRRTGPALLVVAATFVICILTLAALVFVGWEVNFWVFAASYWFFVLCFLMAFGALYKSISLRILLNLSRMPDRADSYANLLQCYIAEESYQSRLTVIQDKHFAVRTGDCFMLTERGRRFARTVRSIQKAFRIENSG